MQIYVNPQNTDQYVIGKKPEGMIAVPSQFSLSDLPHLVITSAGQGEYEFELDITSKMNALQQNELKVANRIMRENRDLLLQQTDFMMTVDYYEKLSESDKLELKTYRQALRDLPSNTQDPREPNYPTKPSVLG